MIHRGPDDQGEFHHPLGQIGMRRLSIIDLGGGHQPIHNEDESIWIVFNGEIYNYRELRRELEAAGHRFYTHSDTECIVHAYEQWGEGCFARLRGMFGIAILDIPRQQLVLGRDRIGKKPLYYTRTREGWLAFASELKCLFPVPGFENRVSAESVRDYFGMGYVAAPHSIYQNVAKLPPAHYMVVKDGREEIKCYWRVEFAPKWTDSAEVLEERLFEQLDDAVKCRLVSDVPFGAFLSGGTDSSVVAALMARNLQAPVKTFTIGFKEQAFNEMPDARAVAQHIGAEHHELVVEADAVAMMDKLVWFFDEPFGDSSSIPTYLVSQLAARHVKMVLSGDGGDEVFAARRLAWPARRCVWPVRWPVVPRACAWRVRPTGWLRPTRTATSPAWACAPATTWPCCCPTPSPTRTPTPASARSTAAATSRWSPSASWPATCSPT
jgi:asparagine synthase (glutamine-hydrolysing)